VVNAWPGFIAFVNLSFEMDACQAPDVLYNSCPQSIPPFKILQQTTIEGANHLCTCFGCCNTPLNTCKLQLQCIYLFYNDIIIINRPIEVIDTELTMVNALII